MMGSVGWDYVRVLPDVNESGKPTMHLARRVLGYIAVGLLCFSNFHTSSLSGLAIKNTFQVFGIVLLKMLK